jgi:DNA-binding transcriptional ArsR family regulator
MKNHKISSSDQKKFEMLKTLNSKPRLRILLFLFIYRKLSLTELSERLGKTKNTVIYHIKRMVHYGIIHEEDEKIPNSIKPIKVYRLNSDLYKQIFTPFGDLRDLSNNEIMEYSKNVFQWNILLFETIREFLRELGDFYTQNEPSLHDIESTLAFHKNHQTPRDLIPLSEQGYLEYVKNYKELIERTVNFLEKEAEDNEELIRPFLAFNIILPIKTLVDFRTKKGEKRKFSRYTSLTDSDGIP